MRVHSRVEHVCDRCGTRIRVPDRRGGFFWFLSWGRMDDVSRFSKGMAVRHVATARHVSRRYELCPMCLGGLTSLVGDYADGRIASYVFAEEDGE